jgi:hypothetical protein
MAKSPTERNKQHLARLRRKAQAFDEIMHHLKLMKKMTPEKVAGEIRGYAILDAAIEVGDKAVQE